MMRVVKCCARGCTVTYQSVPQRTFSIVPRFDKERRSTWLKNVGREDLNNIDNTSRYWVCSDHFSENQFTNTFKSRLRKFAVPDVIPPFNGSNEMNLLSASADEDGLPTPVNKIIHGPLVIELAMPLKSELPEADEDSSKSDNLTYIEIPLNSDQLMNCGALLSKTGFNTLGNELLESYYPNSSKPNPSSDSCRKEILEADANHVLQKIYKNSEILPFVEECGLDTLNGEFTSEENKNSRDFIDYTEAFNLENGKGEGEFTSEENKNSRDFIDYTEAFNLENEKGEGEYTSEENKNSRDFIDYTEAFNLENEKGEDCDENEDNSEKTLSDHYILEKVKAKLCRLCGCAGGSLTPILEETCKSFEHGLPLVKVLEMYLPLQVSVDDSFPLNICSTCHETLGDWHQFYLTCVAANESFKNFFGRGKNQKASSSAVNESSVCEDTGSPKTDHNYVKDELEETEEMEQDFDDSEYNINAHGLNGLSVDKSDKGQSRKEKVYFCKFCRQSCYNRSELKNHVQLCKEEPTVCDKCGKLVQHRKLLAAHRYKEHHYYLRVCDKCGKSVPSKHFSRHCDAFHSGSYYCNLCCTVLCSKTLYNVHMRKHDKGEIKSRLKIDPLPCDGGVYLYQCPICEDILKDLPTMIIHLNEPKVVRCPTCNIKFNNEKRLAIHTCKKWECRFCSKSFFIRERFMEHERIHTGLKPFKCDFCSASFRKKHQRIVHEKTHGAPSHECKYCGKKFKLVTSLRSHINAHEGVFFSCTICDKRFPGENYLHRHMKIHESTS